MLSDSGQLPLGRPPIPTVAAVSTPLATPGRSATPSRTATPGDLAPLALAPVQGSGPDTRARPRGHLAAAPPLPSWPSGAAVSGRLDAGQASPLRGTAVSAEHADYEGRLRSLGVRQDGVEQRLTELAGLFAGMSEEHSGQSRQLEDLCDECRGARSRLAEVEDTQKYMASELRVLTDISQAPDLQKSKHAHVSKLLTDVHVGPAAVADRGAGGARKDEVLEIRQDVRALGQALAALRDRVSTGDGGQPSTGTFVSQLGELGRRVDAHGRRLLALTAATAQHKEGSVPLRRILCEWHALLTDNAGKSSSRALLDRRRNVACTVSSPVSSPSSLPPPGLRDLRSSFSAVNLRVLEHDQQLTELNSHAQLQELQLAKIDSTLETLLCQAPGVLQRLGPGGTAPSVLSSEKYAELLEMVSGQAKAVDDLDFVVRDELQKSRERLDQAEVSQQLVEQIAEQGRAIRDLHGLVEDIGDQLNESSKQLELSGSHRVSHPASPSGVPAFVEEEAAGGVTERLTTVEDNVASLQRNVGTLAAVVRHVQDHAADALDDRIAAAISEVHGRLAGCIASARQDVRSFSLRAPSAGFQEHADGCGSDSISSTHRHRGAGPLDDSSSSGASSVGSSE